VFFLSSENVPYTIVNDSGYDKTIEVSIHPLGAKTRQPRGTYT